MRIEELNKCTPWQQAVIVLLEKILREIKSPDFDRVEDNKTGC